MALQLKGENTSNNNVDKEQENSWDVPLDIDEPKTIYNANMAELQAQQKEKNPVISMLIKMVVALVVCGLVIFAGKKMVSVIKPEGQDITSLLKKDAQTIQTELGVTFTDNPTWSANVYEYSESDPTFAGAEDIGVVYMNGKQIGVHIPTQTYTIFGTRVGDGEVHMYKNTTYQYDHYMSILDTMSGKATLYIYYNEAHNDCIFFLINNTTNRIESMTYYNDYKEVVETLSSL